MDIKYLKSDLKNKKLSIVNQYIYIYIMFFLFIFLLFLIANSKINYFDSNLINEFNSDNVTSISRNFYNTNITNFNNAYQTYQEINVWEKYKAWFIVAICVIILFVLTYTTIKFANPDLELWEVWDWIINDGIGIIITICSIYAGLIISLGTTWLVKFNEWIPFVVLIGIPIAMIIFILLIHLIFSIVIFICEIIADSKITYFESNKWGKYWKEFNCENLENNTVEDLKYYCSLNNMTNYSNLRKSELIELIENKMNENLKYENSYKNDEIDDLKKTKNVKNESNNLNNNKYEHLSLTELKDICRKNKIVGYSSMTRDEIINQIFSKVDDKNNISLNHVIKKTSLNKKIMLDDIAGLEQAKKAFKEKVILPITHKHLFEEYGKKSGGGILLYGLPGTGKTMFAEAISNEIDAKFFSIRCSDIKSKWYGESENKVKKIFDSARKEKRSIIFMDEFEAIGRKRTDDDSNGNNDLVPEILAQMQGVNSSDRNSTILVMAATNRPWDIDSALLRPGRFDEKIYIPLPDFEARKKLFEMKLSVLPHEDLDFDYLASISDQFNGADINEFCEKLKMEAIHKSIEHGGKHFINKNDIESVKNIFKSSVVLDDIKRLKEFGEK